MTEDSLASRPATEHAPPGPPRWSVARSRVARRVVLLFVACALLPVVAVAGLSYRYVGRQLMADADARVEGGAKRAGQAVVERLAAVETALASVASAWMMGGAVTGPRGTRGLLWVRDTEPQEAHGQPFMPPDVTPGTRAHLAEGHGLLRTGLDAAGRSVPLMAVAVGPPDAGGVLWAMIDGSYLAEGVPSASDDAHVCLFAPQAVVSCTLPGASVLRDALAAAAASQSGAADAPRRALRWRDPEDGQRHVVGYWVVFLRPVYLTDPWVIAVAERRAGVLQPLSSFNRTFPPVLLLAVLVVALFSNVQIRRSLQPLTSLIEGTRRLARRDFSTPVVVRSQDEFQEVADSFNGMAAQLDRQFRTIETRSQIDRTVLAALDADRIVAVVLEQLPALVGCDAVVIALAPDETVGPWQVIAREGGGTILRGGVTPGPTDVTELGTGAAPRWLSEGAPPWYLLRPPPAGHLLALPLVLDRRAIGVLVLGYRRERASEPEIAGARQVADQLTVALANTRLVRRLDRMSWGTVAALARAIDAKSPWTAGHSDRVAGLALALGRRLHLDPAELEDLHRGSLLHDVGKIGVDAAVLDKQGELTSEEREEMRSHVLVGAEILSPIPAYTGALPVVRSHHERWDGLGYPDGLRGDAIPLLARVLSVADAYDALTSDRPYRRGLTGGKALARIRSLAGSQFDPTVVRALLAEMVERGLQPDPGPAER